LLSFDLVPKDVMPHADIVPTPIDDARPGEAAEEGAAWVAPSCPSNPSRDDSGERSQKPLERFAAARTQDEMQVGADVGVIVDADAEAARHVSHRASHGAVVSAQGPRAFGPVAGEHQVHGSPRADWALELAAPATYVAAMFQAVLFEAHLSTEERQLHRKNLIIMIRRAMLFR
jgi:hypothetical protein